MAKRIWIWVGVLSALIVASAVSVLGRFPAGDAPVLSLEATKSIGRMVRVSGGTFRMGNDSSPYPDQRPAHDVLVRPFWMDEHEVTNRQFVEFVAQTGYVTTAEEQGWAYVFDRAKKKWMKRPGANWRRPGGPDTNLDARSDYPVVQVSWHDACAYARWAGKQLPSEAQWEYAARAGLRDAPFPWGSQERIDGHYQANYFQGWFPDEDLALDGFDSLAPIKSYRPSSFGLYDISGNVWEWCGDWHAEEYYGESPRHDPRGPAEGYARIQRGGSWLSAENSSPGHKVFVRSKRRPDACRQDVGFRCVRGAGSQPH